MPEQLLRIEAMLAELLRRQTPPEGVAAMQRRLDAYCTMVRDDLTFQVWMLGQMEGNEDV